MPMPRREYEQLVDGKAPAKVDAGAVSAVEAGRKVLGESLRKARETARLTQVELASRLNKSQTMVNGAESGRVRVGAASRASKAAAPKSKAPPGRSRRAGG